MSTTSPQVGEHWAYRQGRRPGNPVIQVEILLPWAEAAAWNRDEEAMAAAFAADDEPYSDAAYWAVYYVFATRGEPPPLDLGFSSQERGVLEIPELVSACELLQLEPQSRWPSPIGLGPTMRPLG